MRIVETTDGRLFQGAVIYESVDGLTLSTPQLQTVRLESREIVRQETSPLSLMPAGLIDDLTCQDLADLYAWLQTIK
jgi:putative heme-binding domain-containing protein